MNIPFNNNAAMEKCYLSCLAKFKNFVGNGNCSTVVPSITIEEFCAWCGHLFPNAPSVCEDSHIISYEITDQERDVLETDDDQGRFG